MLKNLYVHVILQKIILIKQECKRQKLYIQTYTNQLKTKLTNDYSITLQKMYDFYSKLKQLVLQLFYEEDK